MRAKSLLILAALLVSVISLLAEPLRTVEPLILPVWHQDSPWNARCPGQGQNRANAGSHALALAKTMKYWAYPTYGIGSVSYVDDNFGPVNQTFSNEIMWNNMSNTLVFQTTQRFIYMCGASIYTDYEYDFSTSSLAHVQSALINNFSYDDAMQYQHRSDFGNFYWKSIIREELDAARPVIYMVVLASGDEVSFIIDGYNEAGLFHINWSDVDYPDGWFELNDLEVGSQLIPVQNQHMLTGIQPSNGPHNIDESFETDFSNWNWQFSGHQNWTISTEQFFYGSQSAKSGNINDNQVSSLFIQINVSDPDTISFYKKVSCEAEPNDLYDHLAFFIDNVELDRWSGDGSWEYHEYPVSPGVHEFRWTYSKDGASDYFGDCAWLDAIDLPEGTTPLNAPQFVEAEVINGNDIQVNWAPPSGTNPTLQGYQVYRNGTEIVQFNNPSITSYLDSNLPNGDYTYLVRGVYVEGISGPSNTTTITVEVPYAPTNLVATLSGVNTGHLVWDAPPLLRNREVMGFVLYRDNTIIAQIENPETLEYDDPGLVQGVYYYEVSAVYAIGESVRSNMAQLAVGVPYPPGNLQAVVSGSTVNLTWSQVPDPTFLTGFKIFRNGALISTVHNPLQLQYADQNLTNGTYSYFLRAVYSDGDSGNSSTVTVSVEVPYPPANLIATVNGDDVQLSWSNPEATRALTHYLIYRNGQVIAATYGANSTLYLDQNLANGNYTYQVTAFYSGVESAFSAPVNVLIEVLYPPRNLTASVTLANVTLNWSLPLNSGGLRSLNGYHIYRNNVLVTFVTNPAAISYVDQLVPNGTYTYAVAAVYSTGESSRAAVQDVFVEVLYPVENFTYQIAGDDVTLSWSVPGLSPVRNAPNRSIQYYNIYRNGSLYTQTSQTSYLDADLANGIYSYYVTAMYDSGESLPSQVLSLEIEVLYPPTALMAAVSNDDVTLSWTAPVNSGGLSRAFIGYQIYRDGTPLANTTALTYTDSNLANGSYAYYVVAAYAGGISAPTDTVNATVEVLYPPFDLQAAVYNKNNVYLTWQTPPQTGGLRSLQYYRVIRNGTLLTEINALAWNDLAISDGVYAYEIRAVYDSGVSEPCPSASVFIEYPYPPANVTASVIGANVTITWDAVTGTDVEYLLYRNEILITTTLQTSYLDAGLANGAYHYYLTTENASDSGPSDPSSPANVEVNVPYPPQMLTGSVSGSTVTLAWSAPATGPRVLNNYNLYRDGVLIGTTNTQEYSDENLSNGSYSYYVTAVYDSGESIPSNMVLLEVEVHYPATGLQASVALDDVILSWTAANTGTGRALIGYRIFRNNHEIALITETTYTDLNLTNGSYSYYVTAVYHGGTAVPSNTVTVTVEVLYAPSNLSYTIADDNVMLSWTAAANSPARSFSGYNIYRDNAQIAQVTTNVYTDAALANGLYQYHVTAIYSSGESMPTNTVTVALEVLYPATGLSCIVSGDDVSLSWIVPVASGGLRNLLGYKVIRDGVQIAFSNTASYPDNDLANGTYGYCIIASYTSGDALPTPVVQAIVEVLYPPTALLYGVNADAVNLQWTPAATSARGFIGYNVYREGSLLINTINSTYSDTTLPNGIYSYYVTALYSSGESLPTNTIQATVEILYPPSSLTCNVIADDVSLQWTAAATTGGLRGFTGYDLYRDGAFLIHTHSLGHTDSDLPNGNYSYYVTATYDSGSSAPSNTVAALVEVYYPATGLLATVDNDDVSLNWIAASTSGGLRNIQGYKVYRNAAEIATVTGTAYLDSNLGNGSYQYYVIAQYETGVAAPSNIATAIVEVLYPPTLLSHTVSGNSISLTWTAASSGGNRNFIAYNIYREGMQIAQTTATAYTDPGLANGVYQYYVSALYSSGESSFSNTITATIEVLYPVTTLTATVDMDNVNLNWTLPATNQQRAFIGYFIYRNGSLNTVLNDPSQTSWTDSGLANGEYSYYLIALYDSGLSLPSNTVTVNIMVMPNLPAPTGISATVTNERNVLLSWLAPATNVQFYRVFRNNIQIASTFQLSFSDNNLPNGTHAYYVKAQYATGLSSASETVTVNIMIAAPPTGLSASVVDGNSAALGWIAPGQNELGYLILRDGTELGYLSGALHTSYLDQNLANGTYHYQVAAVYPDVISQAVAFAPLTIEIIYAPSDLTLQSISNNVHLSWTAPTDTGGLQHYNIYRTSSLIDNVISTSYTDVSLANGSYQYQISAVYGSGESALTPAVSTTIELAYPPSGLSALVNSDSITLSWNAISDPGGLVNYRIYRNGIFLNTSTTLQYTDNGLANGNYSYYVTAMYSVGESSASNIAAATVEVLYPATALQFNVVDNDVSLSWTAPVNSGGLRNLTGYKIFRDNLQIGTTTQTSYIDLDIGNGTYQYYVVASYNSGDAAPTAPVSVLIEVLYPAANLVYQVLGANVSLAWDAVPPSGATLLGYNVYRNGVLLMQTTTTTYTDTALDNGSYSYYVSARYASGLSLPSNTVVANIEVAYAPSNLTAQVNIQDVVLGWTAAPNGPRSFLNYAIYRNGTWLADVPYTAYTDHHPGNGSYSYYVIAVYSSGSSEPSNIAHATILVAYPPSTVAIQQNPYAANLTIQWTAPADQNGLTAYRIYRNSALLHTSPEDELQYLDQGMPNGQYSYHVTCMYGTLESNASTPLSATVIVPHAPTNLTGTVNGNSVSLSWTPPSDSWGLSNYRVWMNSELLMEVITPQATLNDLDNGSFNFQITAVYPSGQSDFSNTYTAEVIAAYPPQNASCTVTGNDVTIQWNQPQYISGLTNYRVFRDNVQIGQTPTLSYQDNDLANNYYYYTVVAVFGTHLSNPADAGIALVEVIYPPTAPQVQVDADNVTFSWAAVSDPVFLMYYRVYRNGSQIAEINALSYTDNGLANGSYSYTVRAVYQSGPSNQTAPVVAEVMVAYPPRNLVLDAPGNAAYLTWIAPSDTTGFVEYRVYRNDTFLIATTQLGIMDAPVSNGPTTYRISSVYANDSEASAETSTLIMCPYPVQNFQAEVENNDVFLSWNAPYDTYGLQAYQVMLGNDTVLDYLTTDQESYSLLDLDNGYWRLWIRTIYTNNIQLPMQADTLICILEPYEVQNLQVEAISDSSRAVLTWESPIDNWGLTGYRIFRNGVQISEQTETGYIDNNLPNAEYVYGVMAVYGDKYSAIQSSHCTIHLAAPALNVQAVQTDTNFTISWEPPVSLSLPDYYDVYFLVDGFQEAPASWTFVAKVDSLTSVMDTEHGSLDSGDFLWAVFAMWYSGEGLPAFSNILHVSSSPPIPEVTKLKGNFPNPFNPDTTIKFDLHQDGPVKLTIYNARGQLVRTLYNGSLPAGEQQLFFDGRDDKGHKLSSGLYIYRLNAKGYAKTKKMMFMK